MALGYNAKLVLNVEAVDNLVSRALHYRRFAALNASKLWGDVLAAKQHNIAAPAVPAGRILDPAAVSAVRITDEALLAHIAEQYKSLESLLTTAGIALPRIVEAPPAPPPPTPAAQPARDTAVNTDTPVQAVVQPADSETTQEHWSKLSGFRNSWSMMNLIDAHADTDVWNKPLAPEAFARITTAIFMLAAAQEAVDALRVDVDFTGMSAETVCSLLLKGGLAPVSLSSLQNALSSLLRDLFLSSASVHAVMTESMARIHEAAMNFTEQVFQRPQPSPDSTVTAVCASRALQALFGIPATKQQEAMFAEPAQLPSPGDVCRVADFFYEKEWSIFFGKQDDEETDGVASDATPTLVTIAPGLQMSADTGSCATTSARMQEIVTSALTSRLPKTPSKATTMVGFVQNAKFVRARDHIVEATLSTMPVVLDIPCISVNGSRLDGSAGPIPPDPEEGLQPSEEDAKVSLGDWVKLCQESGGGPGAAMWRRIHYLMVLTFQHDDVHPSAAFNQCTTAWSHMSQEVGVSTQLAHILLPAIQRVSLVESDAVNFLRAIRLRIDDVGGYALPAAPEYGSLPFAAFAAQLKAIAAPEPPVAESQDDADDPSRRTLSSSPHPNVTEGFAAAYGIQLPTQNNNNDNHETGIVEDAEDTELYVVDTPLAIAAHALFMCLSERTSEVEAAISASSPLLSSPLLSSHLYILHRIKVLDAALHRDADTGIVEPSFTNELLHSSMDIRTPEPLSRHYINQLEDAQASTRLLVLVPPSPPSYDSSSKASSLMTVAQFPSVAPAVVDLLMAEMPEIWMGWQYARGLLPPGADGHPVLAVTYSEWMDMCLHSKCENTVLQLTFCAFKQASGHIGGYLDRQPQWWRQQGGQSATTPSSHASHLPSPLQWRQMFGQSPVSTSIRFVPPPPPKPYKLDKYSPTAINQLVLPSRSSLFAALAGVLYERITCRALACKEKLLTSLQAKLPVVDHAAWSGEVSTAAAALTKSCVSELVFTAVLLGGPLLAQAASVALANAEGIATPAELAEVLSGALSASAQRRVDMGVDAPVSLPSGEAKDLASHYKQVTDAVAAYEKLLGDDAIITPLQFLSAVTAEEAIAMCDSANLDVLHGSVLHAQLAKVKARVVKAMETHVQNGVDGLLAIMTPSPWKHGILSALASLSQASGDNLSGWQPFIDGEAVAAESVSMFVESMLKALDTIEESDPEANRHAVAEAIFRSVAKMVGVTRKGKVPTPAGAKAGATPAGKDAVTPLNIDVNGEAEAVDPTAGTPALSAFFTAIASFFTGGTAESKDEEGKKEETPAQSDKPLTLSGKIAAFLPDAKEVNAKSAKSVEAHKLLQSISTPLLRLEDWWQMQQAEEDISGVKSTPNVLPLFKLLRVSLAPIRQFAQIAIDVDVSIKVILETLSAAAASDPTADWSASTACVDLKAATGTTSDASSGAAIVPGVAIAMSHCIAVIDAARAVGAKASFHGKNIDVHDEKHFQHAVQCVDVSFGRFASLFTSLPSAAAFNVAFLERTDVRAREISLAAYALHHVKPAQRCQAFVLPQLPLLKARFESGGMLGSNEWLWLTDKTLATISKELTPPSSNMKATIEADPQLLCCVYESVRRDVVLISQGLSTHRFLLSMMQPTSNIVGTSTASSITTSGEGNAGVHFHADGHSRIQWALLPRPNKKEKEKEKGALTQAANVKPVKPKATLPTVDAAAPPSVPAVVVSIAPAAAT